MRRAAEGELPLVAHALPDARVRERGGHVAVRLRGLLLRGLPRDRRRSRDRLGAPVRAGQAAHRLDAGQGGGPHHRRRAPTSRSAWRAATGSPASASTTCPTASSSPGRSRTRSTARSCFSFPASYGGRDRVRRAHALRGRQGRRRLGRAGRGLPASRCSTPTRARAAWASSASAPTTASPPAPRRSCSTRRSAARCTWPIGMSYPESGGTNSSAVHWDMVCDLRQGGSISVDGEELQRDGKFVV